MPALGSQSHGLAERGAVATGDRGPSSMKGMGAWSRRCQPGNAGLNSHRGLKGVSALVCCLLYNLPPTFADASFSTSGNLLQGPEK